MKNVAILGSTGSIGTSALSVLADNPGAFKVVALAAGRNMALLKEQIEIFRPRMAAVLDEDHAARLRSMLGSSSGVTVVSGPDGYCEAAAMPEAHIVLSAMVGAAGLVPTLAAIDAGKDVALANKETMVIAGNAVMARARDRGVRILPVDSEHSAIFQCLEGRGQNRVRRIILTASGGPFWGLSADEMREVRPEEALRHPKWEMGRKITIDSASMMNKGLEVIEARWLFDMPFERIDVVIHRQSVIHSMVEFEDGSVVAQLGEPDMRIPIAYALSYPERLRRSGPFLDFASAGPLTFATPDDARFPCLALARQAGMAGGIVPAVLNAANEVAVEKYLEGAVRFTDIPRIVEAAVNLAAPASAVPVVSELLEADRLSRIGTTKYIEEYMK